MATRYKPLSRREELQAQINERERILRRRSFDRGDGVVEGPHDAENKVHDRTRLGKLNQTDKERLRKMTPPELSDLEKKGIESKRVLERRDQLAEFLKKGGGQFPRTRSVREMQEAPAGAVDLHLMDEQKRKHYNITPDGRIFRVDKKKGQQSCLEEWKDLQRIIHKDMEDYAPNIANAEILRDDSSDNDSLMNYARRSYASPAKNMTDEEFEEAFGTENLSEIQKMVMEREKKGPIEVPSVEDQFKRLYLHEDKPEQVSRKGK